ncbi:hypothetical protein [Terricaulis sp.]|uniref:hypothetical protein n=1 Tax=Terricaulis sp. TaxID=2768686 RepID=UPI003782EF9D
MTDTLTTLMSDARAVPANFTFFRLNGIGTTRGGVVDDPALGDKHLLPVWFTVLFVPVFLYGVYLGSFVPRHDGAPDRNRQRLHARLTGKSLNAAYGGAWFWRVCGASALHYLKNVAWVLGVVLVLAALGGAFVAWMRIGR